MVSSGFVYLHIICLLLPLDSWKQNDEDLKFLSRGFLLVGLREQARSYLERIQKVDAETAEPEAIITAAEGDLQTASEKVRWAQAQNTLLADTDMVFQDTIFPAAILPKSSIGTRSILEFASANQVSDVTLAVALFMLASAERMDIGQGLLVGPSRPGDLPPLRGELWVVWWGDAPPNNPDSFRFWAGGRHERPVRLPWVCWPLEKRSIRMITLRCFAWASHRAVDPPQT